VGDIFKAVRDETDIVPCVCDSVEKRTLCGRKDQCVATSVWKEASQHIKNYLNSVTIADLCEDARRKNLKSNVKDTVD